MKAERLAIPDVILVRPTRHTDPRGFFSETWSAAPYAELGIGPGFPHATGPLAAAYPGGADLMLRL